MSTTPKTAKSIFLEAIENHQPDQWDAFLIDACGDDADLRARVEELLQSHREADSLLDQLDATVDLPRGELGIGMTIGCYRIMEQIGEGGMGAVFVAEQHKPLRRKVALKVIKPGMDTKAVIARFEAERQALALMSHPNIAKVLDAGTTQAGRPFFVMELVRGQPITEYCDEKKLTVPERLRLFIQVCQAIQHAHQKAIIHRDIKPSNVLVTERDGQAIPMVIDFGVAKALNQSLTDRTIYTSFQSVIGTPLYMSPEQAKLSAVDVDNGRLPFPATFLASGGRSASSRPTPVPLSKSGHPEAKLQSNVPSGTFQPRTLRVSGLQTVWVNITVNMK